MRYKQNLELLFAIERNNMASQADLSRRAGVAVGLVNALIKRAVRKGFVKIKAVPARRYAYYLTPKGFAEKSRLVGEYIHGSLEFYRDARGQYSALFERARSVGFTRLAIAGRGELLEIAVLAAMEQGAEVVAIVDGECPSEAILGIPVVKDQSVIEDLDAVIIAECARAQAVFDSLSGVLGADRVLAPPLTCIQRAGADAGSAVRGAAC